MISIPKYPIVLILFLLSAFTGTGYAGDTNPAGYFYTGIEYGSSAMAMKTHFVRDISGTVIENTRFENEYTTNEGGLFLGYTIPWKRAFLGVEGSFYAMDRSFELSAGSSRFVNEETYAAGLTLVPGIYIYKGISVFGSLGWRLGYFNFSKSSPTSTTYDVDTFLNGYTLGGGLACDITPRITLKLGYRYARFDTEEIRASLSVMNDTTRIEPRSDTIFATLQFNFR